MSSSVEEKLGNIKIADEVIAITAAKASMEINGVAGLSGGIAESISNILGKNNYSKGIKVSTEEETLNIDIYLIVKFGVKIPEVAWNVQEKAKKEVENLTGLKVKTVNIHVQGVSFEEETSV